MKLIQEANTDDQFNKLMMKVQDAIEALETLETKLEQPVNTQIRMLEVSGEDLKKLATKLKAKRK